MIFVRTMGMMLRASDNSFFFFFLMLVNQGLLFSSGKSDTFMFLRGEQVLEGLGVSQALERQGRSPFLGKLAGNHEVSILRV